MSVTGLLHLEHSLLSPQYHLWQLEHDLALWVWDVPQHRCIGTTREQYGDGSSRALIFFELLFPIVMCMYYLCCISVWETEWIALWDRLVLSVHAKWSWPYQRDVLYQYHILHRQTLICLAFSKVLVLIWLHYAERRDLAFSKMGPGLDLTKTWYYSYSIGMLPMILQPNTIACLIWKICPI